jgi:hypothetical protein
MSEKQVYKNLSRVLRPDTNLEVIRAYIIAEGEGIQLNEEQEQQKMIIDFTDEQIRSKQGILKRYEIARIISNRFDLTTRTAQRYITLAEELYSSSAPLNKKYKIQLRIEFCEQQQQLAMIDNQHDAVVMYERCIQKYIEMYPEVKITRKQRIQTFILPGNMAQNTLSVEQAVEVLSTQNEEAADEQ